MKNVIFRPTNNCNLACSYCYDKNNHNIVTGKLRKDATDLLVSNEEILLDSFEELFAGEEHPQIIFHGGEPLLISPKVLDNLCTKLKKIKDIDFSIQTNGTLIDDTVIELFKKHKFHVGISLDGCNEQQNYARVFPNNKNSFNIVFKNIKKLQKEGIRHGLIMSISKSQLHGEKDIYNFIAENDFSCNIRPVFASSQENASDVMSATEYACFFNTLFDIWYNDDEKRVGTHQILELYNALKEELVESFHDRSCSNSDHCFKDFISMDVYGELYACNRLYGIEEFHYGNLRKKSLDEIMEMADKLLKIRNSKINCICSDCKKLEKCHGGCPAESYDLYRDILHPTKICEVKSLVKKHVKEILQ